MTRCLIVFMMTLTLITALLLDSKSMNVYAAVRCVNSANYVIAYADNAVDCPVGSRFNGDLPAASQPSSSQIVQAQTQANNDKDAVQALNIKAEQEARMLVKKQLVLQKYNNKLAKRCKLAELALSHAKEKYADINTNNNQSNKSQTKAQRRLERAQAKRNVACV